MTDSHEPQCFHCGTTPAAHRADYVLGALCGECAEQLTSWICPDCGDITSGSRSDAGAHCARCVAQRAWATVPDPAREEVARLLAAGKTILALKLIREVTGCGLAEAVALTRL
ncbi:hypothetical protein ACFWNN_39040 [Lentzea sp. NPDC058450]|uniref:hypothetical protein n=1 Tax=Lentzea sp. NPDC058450 TaxID=3346505 RepID=UPI003651F5D8